MSDEPLELIRQAGSHVTGRVIDEIRPNADVASLGLDSVQVMEMVAVLEERLGIRIPDEVLAELATIDDLDAAVRRGLAEAT